MRASPPKSRSDFDVAIICALQIEADAAEALFDRFWDENGDRYGKSPGDPNAYRTGGIGNHNVVLAYMPDIGKGHAASVAASCRSSFQGIRLTLIVGICGGVPGKTDNGIFLGDVIISDEIVMYDFGRRFPGGFRRKEGITSSPANIEVRTFLQKLKSRNGRDRLLRRTTHHLTELQQRVDDYNCPGPMRDLLFETTYHHKHHSPSRCRRCEKDEMCQKAQEATCETLKCDQKRLVARSRSCSDRLDIHFGRIASGDTVMKSGVERDKIAEEEGVFAFEMEGAGVCNNLPFIVVKGVCDYADSHKDKHWQKYTSGRAAACMKSLLEQWAAIDSAEEITVTEQQSESSEALVAPPQPVNKGHPPAKGHDPPYEDLPEVKLGFKSALACFKANRKCLPRDADPKSLLKTQRVVFLETLDTISSSLSQHTNYKLDLSSKLHLEGAQAIRTKLKEIEDITNGLPAVSKGKSQSTSDADKLKDALEDLASMVQVFVSLIPQPKTRRSLENPKAIMSLTDCREFQHFQIVQQAACSLYDAFVTACNVHTAHDVHLSLQPDLDHKSSRVQFNVAYSQISMTPGKATWIKVESKINLSETAPQPSSLPITADVQSLKRKVHFEDKPPEVRSQVRCQGSYESLQWSLYLNESSDGIPNIHLQRNLCTLMKRHSDQKGCNGCIGSLGENVICTHLAYMDHQAEDKGTSTSLAQLISLSGANPIDRMSFYEQIRLCRYLATAVLYYHATPWLTKAWRSDDIHFFGHLSSLQQTPSNSRDIAMATSVQAPDVSTSSQSQSFNYPHIARNPVLFGLGVMFLELAYEAPLKALQKPVDLAKGGDMQGFADYFTARRVADSGRKVTGSLKAIIKKCLDCDFGHDSDFASPGLQKAFFHEVIGGLQKLEAILQEI
ncbi:hypothetical protein N7454_010739 [Penicillium verhagenii]|nr:hypothetical protein N7454_010739 [Penicillium verhagenii]